PALPVPEAATAMGVRLGTLRRWISQGCPVASRGRRGRGHALLVDPEAVRQWRAAGATDAVVLELAASLPEVLAAAAVDSWQQAQGVDKRALAAITAAGWFVAANAVADHLRARCPAVPEVSSLPEEIERLRKIARQ
ncbi:MAG: hypothetical protein ACREO7_14590, partial [Pseudoxanthomonas sp.]